MSHYGEGSVYRRGNRWGVRYLGKRRSGFATKAEAQKKLDTWRGERAAGKLVSPDAERLTLADLLDMVEADYALNGHKSKPPLSRLRELLGDDARALDLTHDTLTRYAQKRRVDGAAMATIRNELAVLGRGFTLAHRAGKLAQRPPLPTIRVENARTGFFEPEDLAAVLLHLPSYLRPFVEAAYITGWRRSELVNLRWQQVDWNAGQLRLERGTTKSGEPRVFDFAFHPRLAALLREQRERWEAIQRERGFLIEPWVFVHDDGRHFRGWYYDAWRTACERAGLDGRMVHDFRRSAARNLVRANVNEAVAMTLTGHKTRSIFDRYNITSSTDRQEAVAKLATFHDRPVRERVVAMNPRGRRP